MLTSMNILYILLLTTIMWESWRVRNVCKKVQ